MYAGFTNNIEKTDIRRIITKDIRNVEEKDRRIDLNIFPERRFIPSPINFHCFLAMHPYFAYGLEVGDSRKSKTTWDIRIPGRRIKTFGERFTISST